jgi:hypothetical protein
MLCAEVSAGALVMLGQGMTCNHQTGLDHALVASLRMSEVLVCLDRQG